MKKTERVRVNMRLPADLVRWAKNYSRRNGKTFTETVEAGLTMVRTDTNWRSNEVAVVERMLKQEAADGRRPAIAR
jgi:hypothetical protein